MTKGILGSIHWHLALLTSAPLALCPHSDAARLTEGATFTLDGRAATLETLETLPVVDSEFTRRFQFDSADNPKLIELRERYSLADVIAPGKEEFEKQILLLDWVHHRFRKFGRPTTETRGALEILNAIENGDAFFCSQYAKLLVSAAASVGWVDRELALRRHQGANKNGGSTEHSTTEIWSNQHRKWIMLDPTSNLFVEKDGVPLNAWEIRHEWFYREGKDLVFVVGKERKTHRKSDLPIFLKHFDGFGNLTFDPDEPDKYGFIGYVPNTNLMDAGEDYGKMFIVKDALCNGTRWHERTLPANPAVDPYFPLGQAALELQANATAVRVSLTTMTPNFKEFQVRIDRAPWTRCGEHVIWEIHPGANSLEARTINKFGIAGPVSRARISS